MNLNRENNVIPNIMPNQRPNIIPNVLPNRSFNLGYINNNSNIPQQPQQPPSSNRMSGGSQNNTDIYSDNEIQIPTSFDIVIDFNNEEIFSYAEQEELLSNNKVFGSWPEESNFELIPKQQGNSKVC
mgnify:CR=1 FL=1